MYLWIRAFHIISMVAWFAGLFYIFRLFVYHAKFRNKPNCPPAYEEMERKLLYIIMHPAMLATIGFGSWMLVLNPSLIRQPWMHAKLLLVMLLIGYQLFAGIVRRRFAQGDFFLSEKACRMINEIPTILLIGAVILAVVKPWTGG